MFAVVVRPIILFVFGLNVRHRERLPAEGPCVVAAMDYFLRNRLLAWLSLNIIGIIGIDREARKKGIDPMIEPGAALERGEILMLFPEGTRGDPEEMAVFKKGISYLAERYPRVPVIPCFMHGLGKSLPKGAALPVPFFLDVFVGEALYWQDDRTGYMNELRSRVQALSKEHQFAEWD